MNKTKHFFIFSSLALITVVLSVWINHFVFADSTSVGSTQVGTEKYVAAVNDIIYVGEIHVKATDENPTVDACGKSSYSCPSGIAPQVTCGLVGIDNDPDKCNLTYIAEAHPICIDSSYTIRILSWGAGDPGSCNGQRGLTYHCMITCSSTVPVASAQTCEQLGWKQTDCQ